MFKLNFCLFLVLFGLSQNSVASDYTTVVNNLKKLFSRGGLIQLQGLKADQQFKCLMFTPREMKQMAPVRFSVTSVGSDLVFSLAELSPNQQNQTHTYTRKEVDGFMSSAFGFVQPEIREFVGPQRNVVFSPGYTTSSIRQVSQNEYLVELYVWRGIKTDPNRSGAISNSMAEVLGYIYCQTVPFN